MKRTPWAYELEEEGEGGYLALLLRLSVHGAKGRDCDLMKFMCREERR